MVIVNIYEATNMPTTEQEQEKIADAAFNVTLIHVKDGERYFLIRVTAIEDQENVKLRKLDPTNVDDKIVINELMQGLEQAVKNEAQE